MSYKPDDFFVGLVDFFSILLPGALLAYLCKDLAYGRIFGSILPAISSPLEGWAAFIVCAYLFGQFVSLIGATFMDWLYDHSYLAYRRKKKRDLRYERAKEIAGAHANLAGVLKWAVPFVLLRNAEAALQLQRLEATSKFFRGLFVVLLAYSIALAWNGHWYSVGALCVLLVLSYWRFCNQRWKYTESSYLFFIQLSEDSQTAADKR